MPPRSDVALALSLAAIAVGTFLLQPVSAADGVTRSPDALGVLLTLAMTLPVAVRRVHPLAALAIAGPPAIVASTIGYGVTVAALSVWVLVGSTALHSDARTARAMQVVGAISVAGSVAVFAPQSRDAAGLGAALLVGALPAIVGDALRRQRELTDEIRRLRDADVARAAAAERVRIARDVHDTVGHHLAAIGLQARAGELDAGDAQATHETLRTIASLSDRALADTGAILGVLRAADADLEELAATARRAGLGDVTVRGTLAGLPEDQRTCAYRVAQEALTNAARNAAGARATVTLQRGARAVTLRVTDSGARDAPGRPRPAGLGGHGLRGMRERAAALGGSVVAGPLPGGGWQVLLELPAR